ncbi:NACHT domain-containing protein [Streptomyces sp. NPDC020141]|uniref:NACHT domain-containing protein n=1 Tax=Streptomyces sp. NPDC020141 TaxID=3365065 RepID=UPI0037A6BC7F
MGLTLSWRVVAVLGRQQGTGVLIDSKHILTCAHTVEKGRTAEVAHPGTGRRIRCRVLWRGDPESLDAALLRAEDDLVPATGLNRLRWARLTRDDALPGCQTLGFPAHQRYASRTGGISPPAPGKLDFGQYRGSVLPVAGRVHGALTFWLDRSPGTVPQNGASPLSGLSGAPVFAGDVLLGVVARVRGAEGHQHLEAVPAEAIQAALLDRTDLTLPPLEGLSGFDPRDGAFEERYAAALKAQYARTEIFGIDELGVSESGWDLDTAYLSLEATDLADDEDTLWLGPSEPAAVLPPSDSRPRRVEDLLGRSRRTLLRGEAGAGKTTLVWWLAAHAACGTLPPELAGLNGLVPFVVPLRSVRANGGFPGPDELPRIARLPVGGAPDGWAERVLESGRALLLVDGLDELPHAERPKARGWLTRLLWAHSDTRCLVTVRPGAVEADWLAGEGFADLLLLPMSDEDIDAFVTAWHRAARTEYAALRGPGGLARAEAESERLELLERELRREFADHRVLRDLARTPLLCAVVCALHRKRRGRLPRSRWELYRATLDMLLGKRDSERGIDAPEGLTIGVEEHKLLLQHIAVWLVRGGQTQLTPDEAATLIDRVTRAMPQVREQGGPRRILTHLLNRSGLLQQRADDAVQFIHRTFQDYLAAKELAETDSVGELVGHVDDEQWGDVIRLSVGHFDRRVGKLVEALVRAGDGAGPDGRAAHLLAGHCAAAAVFLDEPLRAAAERRIRALIPPREMWESAELAALGPYVLPLLPGPSGDPETDALVIDVISAVGDPSGIELLREFTGEQARFVRGALAEDWHCFPAERYAREVLARVDLSDVHVDVHTGEQLRHLHHCGPVSRVALFGGHTSKALDERLPRTGLTEVSLIDNPELTTLAPLGSRPSVTSLVLVNCPEVESLAGISDRPFDELVLDPGALSLPGPPPRVRRLQVNGAAELPYDALARWTGAEELTVGAPAQLRALLRTVKGLPDLWSLRLGPVGDHDPEAADEAPGITHLSMTAPDRPLDTGALARVFPALRMLSAVIPNTAEYAIDLTPLHGRPELTVHLHRRPGTRLDITGGEHFGDRLSIGPGDD